MTAKDYLTTGKPSALGFGGMRMPSDNTELAKMVDLYLDSGYNYFDTAYIYNGSEEAFGKALVSRHPRESFVIASKLPPWEVNESPEDCEKIMKEQLRRTGLDYFDFYLVHSLSEGREQDIEDKGLFEWCVEQKKKGLIKHLGFSFHGGTAYLERLLDKHPETEFVQLQQNYMDNLRGPASEWQNLAIKYKQPIIVMEPVKGGSLAALPAPAEKLLKEYAPDRSVASWAIQYAATLDGVTCVLSGMSNLNQLHDNLQTFKNLKPLSSEEKKLLDSVLAEMSKVANIPCTACKYCHSECPLEIDIAANFSLCNEVHRGSEKWNTSMTYRTIPESRRASACIKCGACLAHCPQHIDIPKELDTVVEMFK